RSPSFGPDGAAPRRRTTRTSCAPGGAVQDRSTARCLASTRTSDTSASSQIGPTADAATDSTSPLRLSTAYPTAPPGATGRSSYSAPDTSAILVPSPRCSSAPPILRTTTNDRGPSPSGAGGVHRRRTTPPSYSPERLG